MCLLKIPSEPEFERLRQLLSMEGIALQSEGQNCRKSEGFDAEIVNRRRTGRDAAIGERGLGTNQAERRSQR
jgi:hypothetical protein